MPHFEVIEFEGQKVIRATINNETIRAESGALHYMQGNIEMSSKAPSAGGMLKSMVAGENIFRPTYSGTGVVVFGPPHFGEYILLHLNNEEWILDRGAYVCSDMGIEVGVFRNKAFSGLMGGEGFFQTSVKGTGTVVIQAPGKVQNITLNGDTLSVDGSFAVARQSTLQFSVKRASKSLMGSMTSGEGFLNTFQGQGTVLLAPVPNLYQSLAGMLSFMPTAAGASATGGSNALAGMMQGGIGKIIGIVFTIIIFICAGGMSLIGALSGQ